MSGKPILPVHDRRSLRDFQDATTTALGGTLGDLGIYTCPRVEFDHSHIPTTVKPFPTVEPPFPTTTSPGHTTTDPIPTTTEPYPTELPSMSTTAVRSALTVPIPGLPVASPLATVPVTDIEHAGREARIRTSDTNGLAIAARYQTWVGSYAIGTGTYRDDLYAAFVEGAKYAEGLHGKLEALEKLVSNLKNEGYNKERRCQEMERRVGTLQVAVGDAKAETRQLEHDNEYLQKDIKHLQEQLKLLRRAKRREKAVTKAVKKKEVPTTKQKIVIHDKKKFYKFVEKEAKERGGSKPEPVTRRQRSKANPAKRRTSALAFDGTVVTRAQKGK